MSRFYSPYQFIPVTGRRQAPDRAAPDPVATRPWPEIAAGRTPARHDGWDPDTLSGRLLCRVRTVTPTLVGAEQGSDAEGRKTIANYQLLGELAIPGSSLRGAIGAVAEAISQSAMRVLTDREFTVRKGRRREPARNLYDAFERHATRDVLPWHLGRKNLTTAECLFGVVEDLPQERSASAKARNLASRVTVSDARGLAPPLLYYPKPVPLRPLQSPKPPSPAMYFRTAEGGAVRKRWARREDQGTPPLPELDPATHVPNGRKYYLPHDPKSVLKNAPWETRELDDLDRLEPEMRADRLSGYEQHGGRLGNPLAVGQDLWFHIDFENLSKDELDLLWTAVDPGSSELRPKDAPIFHHRLGWGRPLGLGVVRIEVAGFFQIKRTHRYSASGLTDPRYHGRWLGPAAHGCADLLRGRYPDEFANDPTVQHPDAWRSGSALVDPVTLGVLLCLGNPAGIHREVCYPYVAPGTPGSETEGYKWFNANDHSPDKNYQFLGPLVDQDGKLVKHLPTLRPGGQ